MAIVITTTAVSATTTWAVFEVKSSVDWLAWIPPPPPDGL